MPQQLVQIEATSLTPTALLHLFTLDASVVGIDEPFYFYDGTANGFKPLVFNGVSYTPFPIKMEDFSINGQGQPVRPKVTIANPNGFVSNLLLNYQNLNRAKLSRVRVRARFIDAVNFPRGQNPWGTPDPTAAYDPEIFYINRKISENNQFVSWELATLQEVENVTLPRRKLQAGVCGFGYRDASCLYSGVPVADQQNKLFVGGAGTYGFASLTNRGTYSASETYNAGDYVTTYSLVTQLADVPVLYVCLKNGTSGRAPWIDTESWVADACPRSCAGCRLRYPAPAPLRGGFFPGVTLAPYAKA
jgi:lambda family phage minor tail protein L